VRPNENGGIKRVKGVERNGGSRGCRKGTPVVWTGKEKGQGKKDGGWGGRKDKNPRILGKSTGAGTGS